MSKSTECSNLIVTAKENYPKKMAEKLDNPYTAPKAYWSIFNNFLGKRKTPNISPLIVTLWFQPLQQKLISSITFSPHNALLW